MKNLPFFATEEGTASLLLEQIPWTGRAYVCLQTFTGDGPEALCGVCADFCRAAGAREVYASGADLAGYPLDTELWELELEKHALPPAEAETVSVGPDNQEVFRQVYRERMEAVPAAAICSDRLMARLVRCGAWLVYDGACLLGIGAADGNVLLCLAATVPGAGKQVISAVAQHMPGPVISLQAASANERAMRLYRRLGFRKTKKAGCWYRIYP